MSKSYDEKPDTWADWGTNGFKHAGGDIYYTVISGEENLEVGGKASNVWVYHWHTPTNAPEGRWQLSACGLHTVDAVEPLSLSPSLACEDGCPSHGYLKEGKWQSV